MKEDSLDGYRWTYNRVRGVPLLAPSFMYPNMRHGVTITPGESFPYYESKGDSEGPYFGTVHVRGNPESKLILYASAYRRIIDTPEVRKAITKYLYYPITVK